MNLTHFSTFTGNGGIDIAGEMAGFETVGQCELAEYPYQILCKHWHSVPKWRDIRDVTGESVRAAGIKRIDLLSGGFPCQPFSNAGKRRGQEDDRYLWPEMLRVIKELKPTWVLGENVDGITNMGQPICEPGVESKTVIRSEEEDFYEAVYTQQEIMQLHQIREDLKSIGYESQPIAIPACAVGTPHRRMRIFIVAHYGRSLRQGSEFRRTNAVEIEQQNANIAKRPSETQSGADVGYTEHNGQLTSKVTGQLTGTGRPGSDENVAYPNGDGLQGNKHDTGNSSKTGAGINSRSQIIRRNTEASERSTEPGLGGNINGITGWMDGIRWPAGLGGSRMWPTPTVSDIFTSNLKSTQQKQGSMHSVTLPQAVNMWPAGRGQPQYEWEPPRVAVGVKNRGERLKCLGNMVVPWQVYPILKFIYEIEKAR